MSYIPSRKQWRRWALPNKLSVLGALFSILGLLLTIPATFLQGSRSADIDTKIRELDEIQAALTTLSSYVGQQQMVLKRLSGEKEALEKERERVQRVLEIDREKLNALLEYQIVEGRRLAWIEILISFFVGVLSSSVVTFAAISLQNRKKPQLVNESKA